MKKQDLLVLVCAAAILLACALTPNFLDRFIAITKGYPYLSSFVKFALLSTFGECLGLRVTSGVWNRPGFGVLPRAFVWGCLGMGIKMAFTVYSTGVPNFLVEIGLLSGAGAGGFGESLIRAFFISMIMNFTWAPFFMTLHKITDLHIAKTGGTLKGFFTNPVTVGKNLSEINWQSLWGFVFKKTLPLFWVPAHTITFMLPPYFQVVFAAALGVVLGLLLALAGMRSAKSA